MVGQRALQATRPGALAFVARGWGIYGAAGIPTFWSRGTRLMKLGRSLMLSGLGVSTWRFMGPWAVISRGISRVTVLITQIRGLVTQLITTPEPPSRSKY